MTTPSSTPVTRLLRAWGDGDSRLAALDPPKSQIVELRFFGGLDIEETAEVIKVSPRTVKREWSLARAWLSSELSQKGT